MEQAVPGGPDARPHHHGGQQDGHIIEIDVHDHFEAFDLALRLPDVLAAEAPGGAGDQQRDNGQEGQARGHEGSEPPAQRPATALAKAIQLEGQQADAVDPRSEQVAEEQRHHEHGGDHEAPRPRPVAQEGPGGEGEQRQPDAEIIIHHPDEEDGVVEQRKGHQRQRRPHAEQRPVKRQRSARDEGEAQQGIDLAGGIDVGDAVDDRNDEVHHHIRKDGPLEKIEARDVGVVGQLGDDVHAREMVHIVRQGRQGVRQDGHRHQRETGDEQQGDPAAAQIMGQARRCGAAGVAGSGVGHQRRM